MCSFTAVEKTNYRDSLQCVLSVWVCVCSFAAWRFSLLKWQSPFKPQQLWHLAQSQLRLLNIHLPRHDITTESCRNIHTLTCDRPTQVEKYCELDDWIVFWIFFPSPFVFSPSMSELYKNVYSCKSPVALHLGTLKQFSFIFCESFSSVRLNLWTSPFLGHKFSTGLNAKQKYASI